METRSRASLGEEHQPLEDKQAAVLTDELRELGSRGSCGLIDHPAISPLFMQWINASSVPRAAPPRPSTVGPPLTHDSRAHRAHRSHAYFVSPTASSRTDALHPRAIPEKAMTVYRPARDV